MSVGNISYELENTLFPIPSTTPVKILQIEHATYGKLCVLGYVKGIPTTYAMASDGYVKDFGLGCMMIDTANGKLYVNSNITAPSWSAQA